MTHVCKFEYCSCFQFHVLALHFPPDLVNGLSYEFGFIFLVRTQTPNQILESALPHRRGFLTKWQYFKAAIDVKLANGLGMQDGGWH